MTSIIEQQLKFLTAEKDSTILRQHIGFVHDSLPAESKAACCDCASGPRCLRDPRFLTLLTHFASLSPRRFYHLPFS